MSVTLKDIARECGYSYSTVSKALKNSPLVTEKTRSLIQQKADEMNYVPNHTARSLVSKKSKTIGLIWPAVDKIAITHLISEINLALKEMDYFMLVSIDEPLTAAQRFLELRCDGIIIFDEGPSSNLPPKIYNNIPVVAYGVNRSSPYPLIDVNHKQAIIEAVEFLLGSGIGSIDYIGDLKNQDLRQVVKREAFIQYCQKNYISYRLIDSSGLTSHETQKSLRTFMKENELSRGIICESVDITVGLANELEGPIHQYMVVSYDNVPHTKKISDSIKVVGVPTNEIAKSIITTLSRSFNKKNESNIIELVPTLE